MKYIYKQYLLDKKFLIKHNYLKEQFSDYKKILKKISKIVKFGDFTLGKEVEIFEKNFKKVQKSKYAIGVGSGTDALMLSLIASGIKTGDEVITSPFTFYATIGAIAAAGATPVFADIGQDFNIDPREIEKKITSKTKAILVVHWTGRICDMKLIKSIARKNNLKIIEDACHAINAKLDNVFAGNFGDFGCFSMHPLKNLNVWGDGGVIVTNNKKLAEKIFLLRNHGLVSRNINKIFGYNSRLDTIQAVVANHLLKKINFITNSRISNAKYLDTKLKNISEIKHPTRQKNLKEVFHIYSILVKKRNSLVSYLQKNKIDVKIHYPKPMHLQPASKYLNYKKGSFPKTEYVSKNIISLPIHEYITKKNLDYMIKKIKEFYSND